MDEDNELTGLESDFTKEPVGALDTATDYEAEYRKRVKQRESKFGEMIGAIDAATKKLLEKPVQERPGFFRELAGALARPTDPRDPRFYEKRNFFTALRDIGEYGTQRREEEKKLLEARQSQVEKLQDLKRKYEFEEAQSLEDRAFEAMKTFGKPQKGRALVADAQKILDLESIINNPTASENAKLVAKNQLDEMKRGKSEEDNTRLGQLTRALKMSKSTNPAEREEGLILFNILSRGGSGGKELTLSQLRQDEEILRARGLLKGIPQRDIDMAFRKGQYRNARENDIVRAYNIASRKTYAEMLAGGASASAPAPADDEEVIEEEMP